MGIILQSPIIDDSKGKGVVYEFKYEAKFKVIQICSVQRRIYDLKSLSVRYKEFISKYLNCILNHKNQK